VYACVYCGPYTHTHTHTHCFPSHTADGMCTAAGGSRKESLGRVPLTACVVRVACQSQSPVHDAARAGSEKCLRSLKQAGADMKLQTGNGSTALHYAAQYDKFDVIKYFLGALDDTEGLVDIANASGQTALHVAARYGKEKSAEALLSFNANVLLLDKIGRSAEKLAEENKFPVVVTMLKDAAVAQCEAQVSAAELALKNVRCIPRYAHFQGVMHHA
jgi:hypothetical protein